MSNENTYNIENSIHYADTRHPVDFIEPVEIDEAKAQAAEALARLFIWIAEGRDLEQRGLRATIILWCLRPDLVNGATLHSIGLTLGYTKEYVHKLADDFRQTFAL